MALEQDAVKTLAKEINDIINQKLSQAHFDRTVKARVTDILNEHKYLVMIGDCEYETISYFNLYVGDVCFVTIPQNDYNNLFVSSPYKEINRKE